MSSTLVGLLVLVLLAGAAGGLAVRAWGARLAWIRWPGVALAGVFTLLFAVLAVTGALGAYKVFRRHTVAVPAVSIAGTPEQIARGEHLADVVCAACHSRNGELPLTAGTNLSQDTGLPLGDIYAPNITPGGEMAGMADDDLFRIIRTGVNEDGRATAMAALLGPRSLSDDDILTVIAYLRQAPPSEADVPPFKPTVLLSLFVGAGLVSLDVPPAVDAVSAPPKAATAEYGAYVAAYLACQDCHGPHYDGNVPPPNPPAPDIRPGLSTWTKEQFFGLVQARALASTPGEIMPWKFVAHLDDVELEALYAYLHQVAGR